MNTSYSILRLSLLRGLALVLVVILTSLPPGAEAQTSVTLPDGMTYQVKTVRGRPVGFANEQIIVQDLGITARFMLGNPDAPPYVRVLFAELLAKGQFTVTVTSPLDTAATATLTATGPGKIILRFFPQADYPKIWDGIDTPGVHWFPFNFVFEDKQSGNRFEFTQWTQLDDQTWKEMQAWVEKVKQQQMLKK